MRYTIRIIMLLGMVKEASNLNFWLFISLYMIRENYKLKVIKKNGIFYKR